MRTTSRALADKFLDVVGRLVAALHQQRAIEARRLVAAAGNAKSRPRVLNPGRLLLSYGFTCDTHARVRQPHVTGHRLEGY